MKKKTYYSMGFVAGIIGILAAISRYYLTSEITKPKKNIVKTKIYPQDKFLNKTLLRFIPEYILPSYFSILRIILTPLAAYFIVYGDNLILALVIYVSVSFTDMIDGALARTRNQVTEFGKIIDPIADKLLLLFITIFLLPKFNLENLLFLILFMEFMSVVIGYFYYRLGNDMSSNIFGKMKMNMQILGIVLFVFANYTEISHFKNYGVVVLILSVILHMLSVITFMYKTYHK